MRYRIKEYNIGGDTDFSIAGKVSIEDIRLIVNETQKKVICSSMNKSNVACNYIEDMDVTFITFDNSICELQPTDQLTIEIDKGDNLSSVERKVEEVGSKIDNIKFPEIDTTNIASKDLEKFFGVNPIDGYEFMTAEEICAELEEIMTSMDLELTQEMAKEITNNTLNKG